MVDKNARIQHSMIFSRTYVGRQTHIYQSLVNGDQVFNAKGETLTRIKDPTRLGSLIPAPSFSKQLPSWLNRWLTQFNPFTA